MIKYYYLLFLLLGLISCKPEINPMDYYGQPTPGDVPIIFAPDIISLKGRLEHGISFSPDGTELAFGVLNQKNYKGDIYYSKRNNNIWSEIKMPDFMGEGSFFLPYFTPDGKSILFAKSIPDSSIYDYSDIWIVTKKSGAYSNPERINEPVSSSDRDASASMTLDGTIYIASGRDHLDRQCWSDIYCSRQNKGEYKECNRVEIISSENDEESIFISPNEDYIITCGNTNSKTWLDLYISYRNFENKWIKPQIIDSTINSQYWDRRPFVSIDNKYLFFTRSQVVENGLTESDIYWVNTSKLFKPYVYNPILDTIIKMDSNYKYQIDNNTFKDINCDELKYELLEDDNNNISWLEFDKDKMILSGVPKEPGKFDFILQVIDTECNFINDKFTIMVE